MQEPLDYNKQFNELIEACMCNKRDAQYKLYKLLSAKMFGVCLRYAKDNTEAEDILQEGFVKVFNNLDKFRGDGSFEGWVRRIMVNTSIEHYRKNNKMYSIVNVEQVYDASIADDENVDLEVEDIMKLIQDLSPGYRTVFNMYVVEGYSHKEIAEQLGISEGTSKSQLARARYLLMEMLEKANQIKIQKSVAK
ncbi:MAG: RNA polymerase sigma factor [Chitinophagales bacterium]|nr:RNA polymerase sigma factor [Chitinophagales bacterium]